MDVFSTGTLRHRSIRYYRYYGAAFLTDSKKDNLDKDLWSKDGDMQDL